MLFSIIIPFHNNPGSDRSAMMNELLMTIPDRPDLEIILVDDRSTSPFSPVRVFDRASLRIEAVPAGFTYAGMARNFGMDIASGEWVIFADSDDLFDPAGLLIAMDVATGVDGAEADVIVFLADSFMDTPQGRTRADRHTYNNRLVYDRIRGDDPNALARMTTPWCRLARVDFLANAGIRFGRTRVAEDHVFATALALASPRICALPVVAYMVRESADSLVRSYDTQDLIDRITAVRASNQALRAGNMAVHATPLYRFIIELARMSPRLGAREIWRSARCGDMILPSPAQLVRAFRRRYGSLR